MVCKKETQDKCLISLFNHIGIETGNRKESESIKFKRYPTLSITDKCGFFRFFSECPLQPHSVLLKPILGEVLWLNLSIMPWRSQHKDLWWSFKSRDALWMLLGRIPHSNNIWKQRKCSSWCVAEELFLRLCVIQLRRFGSGKSLRSRV